MVFQDPYGSLDLRQTVETIVTEPLRRWPTPAKAELRERAPPRCWPRSACAAGDAH